MRIAIFDYRVVPGNPVGSCHLHMLRDLCREHEFTVFAVDFENPDPQSIRWVRIPAPTRPLPLLFVSFHVLAAFCYLWQRLVRRRKFDLIQMVESNLTFGDVSYSHFCHRAYLTHHLESSGPNLLRQWSRWLDHRLHSLVEPVAYRRTRTVIVPSHGLARELQREYPATSSKTQVLSNPVDTEYMRRPAGFDRFVSRRSLNIEDGDLTLAFVALGHFERKGLGLLFDALAEIKESNIKLVIAGGSPSVVASYRSGAARRGISSAVVFAGMQRDVRPFLWMADAFVFPSAYEVFSLALLEAAAAGLPLIVPPLNGAEEFVRDGVNGFLIERSVEGVLLGIARLQGLSAEQRARMAIQAQRDVARYSVGNFVSGWRAFYGQSHVA
jgi:glycosyltransferase involved in cell wall biosynthesis